MKPEFAVVSDGSCDLPGEEATRNGIEIVHFLVSFDEEHYQREGVDISLSEFYQTMVDHPKQYPKTAAPSPEDFCRAFEPYASQGTDILNKIGNRNQNRRLPEAHVPENGKLRRPEHMADEEADNSEGEARGCRQKCRFSFSCVFFPAVRTSFHHRRPCASKQGQKQKAPDKTAEYK